jgi:phosphonate dehydrogenase
VTRPRVVLALPVHEEVRRRLEHSAEVDMHTGPEPLAAPLLAQRLGTAQALMGFMTERVDAALLAAGPNLRIVAAALKGSDNYDAQACSEAGVWLSIVPDLLTAPTAELAIGLAIALGRHVRQGDTLVRSGGFGGWRPQLYGRGLEGSTVAVLGLGALGRAICARLRAFGCRLLGVDRQPQDLEGVEPWSLDEALAMADFIVIALPLTSETRHLIDRHRIARASRGALWVNVGRGSVVDENAMAEALQSGQAGGYAADVFAFEDWADPGRPYNVNFALRARTNTLFTPHLGSAVAAVRLAIEHRAVDNILAVLAGGEPPDAVNRPQLRSKAEIAVRGA